MGELADMLLDGTLCQVCGALVSEEPQGFPQLCPWCTAQEREETQGAKRKHKRKRKRNRRNRRKKAKWILTWANEEIAKIEADERFHYPPASVQVNAPLALIQTAMKARMDVLKQVIGRLGGNPPADRKRVGDNETT